MALLGALDSARTSPEVDSICTELKNGAKEQMVYGLAASQKTYIMAAVMAETSRPALIVTETLAEAENIARDMRSWTDEQPLVFPALEALPFEVFAQSVELVAPRIAVLEALVSEKRPTIVAPIAALLRKLPPKEAYAHSRTSIRLGERFDLDRLGVRLALGGYEHSDMVEAKGQFGRRGGILDIYPLTDANPIRIEFFDDEVDSIRHFDPHTQRSLDSLAEYEIPPARELVAPEADFDSSLERIRRDLAATIRRLSGGRSKQAAIRLEEKVGEHLERLETSRSLLGLEQYAPYFYESMATLSDYLPADTVVMVAEYLRMEEAADVVVHVYNEMCASLIEEGTVLAKTTTAYHSLAEITHGWKRHQAVYYSLLLRRIQHTNPQNVVSFQTRSAPVFHGQWPVLVEQMRRWKNERQHIILAASGADRARRLSEQLRQDGIENSNVQSIDSLPAAGSVTISVAPLEAGFEAPLQRLVVLTDVEIYGKPRRSKKTRAAKDGSRLSDFRQLKDGDYVVHINHGVGVYQGIRTLEVDKTQKDYLFVKYAGADALYVPVDQVALIQKYVGAEGHSPRINKLGGAEWARVKHRVRESVQDMAQELLRLYAVRESAKGFAYSEDTPWQAEFEDAFRYEETPDQIEAIAKLKEDMQKSRPMDRLIVGDVGYGKTEVAIRGVFKAVMEGKQAAVLVPTTILAQQHYNTFRERFGGFAVSVRALSRFLTSREQAEVVKAVKQGTVDVLIGTHRLLQADISFKNLGLLVVDEEHRFGVAHKERIKQLRHNVDVLTLSATPIPRTLSMALSGIRDMSLIETPPEDRYPVQTYVLERDDRLIKDAISREIARGGQVFFVHNRVRSIGRVADEIRRLLPECRVAVGHGQMREDQLERVMIDFINGEFDVLVCTTIIESGLDMPNVNTIIIDDADHLGLAQLYQLRGRVGRSNRVAFAYLTYRKQKVLTELAEKRLSAVRELTELGSGFRLAMRDLEIRGAGNVLGPEQHGFIVSVGFDLYVQLLDEAIRELKGEAKPAEPPSVSIDIRADAFIPTEYVPDPRQKYELYKKVAMIETLEDADDVAEEMLDRYGDPPSAVRNLLTVTRLKARARTIGVRSIAEEKGRLTFRFDPEDRWRVERILRAVRAQRAKSVTVTGRSSAITLRLDSVKSVLAIAEQYLMKLEAMVND